MGKASRNAELSSAKFPRDLPTATEGAGTLSSRQTILETLRAQQLHATELPSLDQAWIRYDDPYAQFEQVLASVGGKAVRVADRQAIALELAQHEGFRKAQRIFSSLPEVWQANVDLAATGTPHELADVDFAIVQGELAVAENGAVWVTDELLHHRAILFLPRHLAIVVPADRLVSNMHEAYETIRFAAPRFGLFISGPSKTADIEQSLVIGAHGPRTLTVFLEGTPPL
jgi:L-lactate dehydrogenase complex protein LldG